MILRADAIKNILNLQPELNAPEIIVYCNTETPRLQAACRFIFETALQCRFKIIEGPAPESSQQAAIVYSSQYTGTLAQIIPAGLLEEKGISRFKPTRSDQNGLPVFFQTTSEFGFDIFSAVFYFISRYEEYQDFEPDEHQRFELKNSILFQNNLHTIPLLEKWCQHLKFLLIEKNQGLSLPGRQFQMMSSLDIDNLFAYRHKGLLRTLGASFRDLLNGRFHTFSERLLVLCGRKKDPFDIYQEIADLCYDTNVVLFCFFLMRSGTQYDRSVNPDSAAYQHILKLLQVKFVIVGLHPSYHASESDSLLQEEIRSFKQAGEQNPYCSRQHYLRFNIRTTPAQLLKAGITIDFTMGFASGPGFRAGTSLPFRYYNFETEKNEEFLFVPFCAMDGAWSVYGNADAEAAFEQLKQLATAVKEQNGIFLTVFHERSFSDHLYPGFGNLYKKLIKQFSGFFGTDFSTTFRG